MNDQDYDEDFEDSLDYEAWLWLHCAEFRRLFGEGLTSDNLNGQRSRVGVTDGCLPGPVRLRAGIVDDALEKCMQAQVSEDCRTGSALESVVERTGAAQDLAQTGSALEIVFERTGAAQDLAQTGCCRLTNQTLRDLQIIDARAEEAQEGRVAAAQAKERARHARRLERLSRRSFFLHYGATFVSGMNMQGEEQSMDDVDACVLEMCIELEENAARLYARRLRGVLWRERNQKRNLRRHVRANMCDDARAKHIPFRPRNSTPYNICGSHPDVLRLLNVGRVNWKLDCIEGAARQAETKKIECIEDAAWRAEQKRRVLENIRRKVHRGDPIAFLFPTHAFGKEQALETSAWRAEQKRRVCENIRRQVRRGVLSPSSSPRMHSAKSRSWEPRFILRDLARVAKALGVLRSGACLNPCSLCPQALSQTMGGCALG